MSLPITNTTRRLALIFGLMMTACGNAAAVEAQRQAGDILSACGTTGGLIVHVGCGDGRLTAALKRGDGYLVHGLDRSAANVAAAREYLRGAGLYGPVSVDSFDGAWLPYAENMVNLLVADELGDVAMAEVMRVLVPNGTAYVKKDGEWTKTVKSWPQGMDQWTHFLHGPDNNAVAHDQYVGPPRHIRWQGLPKFSRAHEQLASLSACVTAGGRMFYVVDEAPRADIRLPSQWVLVARDAFNGVVLWKKPIDGWANQLRRFRSGPPHLPFRLVADQRRLFVTLGFEAPVSVLEATTGKLIRVVDRSEFTKQIIHTDSALALLIDKDLSRAEEIDAARRRGEYIQRRCQIARADVASGEIAWQHDVDELVFPCMALSGDRLFYQTPAKLHCIDFLQGKLLWSVPLAMNLTIPANKVKNSELQWNAPTIVARDEMVLVADFRNLVAYSVADGTRLWSGPSSSGYNSPTDILIVDDLVWTKGARNSRTGLDPATGQPRRSLTPTKGYMHPRCYRNKATDRFIMLGETGVQFVDVKTGEIWQNHWIRGTCQYGIMPANGLLYVTPDSCACNMKTKLAGLFALASDRPAAAATSTPRWEKGPAYEDAAARATAPAQPQSDQSQPSDWPTYRHDAKRSGMTAARIAPALSVAWQTELGGKLSSLVAAEGKVWVASVDTHTVYALDGDSGEKLWSFTAGGRIDSPPTIYNHLVLFGSADGWIYALRSNDGALAWRFRAAPEDRRVFIEGQLESVWPVHGSVLVNRGVIVATAGRSSYLDGGLHLVRLEVETGKLLSERVIFSPDDDGKQPPAEDRRDVRGALSDILSADGDAVYMRQMKIDFSGDDQTQTGMHLFTPIGYLDDTWWHRAYWVVNDQFTSHWSGWHKTGNRVPSGRILSYDQDSIYGFGRDQYPSGNTGQWRGGETYQLYALRRDAQPQQPPIDSKQRNPKILPLNYTWNKKVPILIKAMVVADEVLFVAGPPDLVKARSGFGDEALVLSNPQEVLDAWNGKKGGRLWAVSAASGRKLAEVELDSPPNFDGMIAAGGCIYVSTADGKVLCLAGQ